MKDTQREISQICDEIKNMLLEKNLKYGDSALNPIRIMSQSDSVEQIKVRIDDKLSRLSRGELTDDEDVINDLIGYFVLLKIARSRDSQTVNDTITFCGDQDLINSPEDYAWEWKSGPWTLDNLSNSSYTDNILTFPN